MQFAPVYPYLYRLLKSRFPSSLWCGSPAVPYVALTFDDGPHPEYTPQLLDVLDRYGVRASFFWLGVNVARFPAIAREVHLRGHWLALHGYEHRAFPRLTPTELHDSLERTRDAISSACDLDPALLRDVRPPNGIFTPKTLKLLNQWHYRPVMWSVVPEDWVEPGVERVCQRVLTQIHWGAIVVLHDGYFGGQSVAQTAACLIPQLRDREYDFVTIDRFWNDVPPPSLLN
ncbi:polysaccharide deacetylase family protein [Oscillatoria sp. FACHB-1406]|uniref:polysaccharide deacetylase family protein n=1 Tax=Oscillatoria sp. FACHB-1406 TaxID=2692846 RepID=UPI001684FDDE|nr:polysaccharide deacetylase family protein [Oscillatoria sp. FACHB-1406]MBD2579299.1 polysaccharide deacetylase family protein [Oscillatoria sp. FACHB-1406]